ncbi:hypothetical protein [Noviherbaspirillum agri]
MAPELVPDDPLVDGVVLLPELLLSDDPLVPLISDVPDVPEVPDEEAPDVVLSVFGVVVCVVVVVVTAPWSPLPDEAALPEVPLLPEVSVDDPGVVGAALGVGLWLGSLVVVVVVVWPNEAVAVPISDRKMAMGNFFMLAPTYEWWILQKLPKMCFRPLFLAGFASIRARSDKRYFKM